MTRIEQLDINQFVFDAHIKGAEENSKNWCSLIKTTFKKNYKNKYIAIYSIELKYTLCKKTHSYNNFKIT